MKTLRRRRRPEEGWEPDPWDDPDVLYEFEGEVPQRGHWPAKVLGYGFFLVLVAFLLTAGAVGLWVVKQVNPGNPGAARNFTVNLGDTPESIAHRLKTQGIITNERVFVEYTARQGGLKIEPGYYTVRPKDTMGNIMLALNTPPAETFTKVTFPEGYTVAQMAARLAEKVPQLTAESFIQSAMVDAKVQSPYQPAGSTNLEGLLFPDTYQVAGNETVEQVVRVLEQQMERVAGKENIDDEARRSSLVFGQTLTQYEVLIVASMIEKEAKFAADRPLIARVIYNRLALGMPLQVDATLRYGQDPSTPFSALKELDTPYNSYLHTGLPPTPITNPSRASIAAAMNPAANPDGDEKKTECPKQDTCLWLYYVVADKDGHHVFATNEADHERNVDAARRAGLLG
jgi:UPF0755 protein